MIDNAERSHERWATDWWIDRHVCRSVITEEYRNKIHSEDMRARVATTLDTFEEELRCLEEDIVDSRDRHRQLDARRDRLLEQIRYHQGLLAKHERDVRYSKNRTNKAWHEYNKVLQHQRRTKAEVDSHIEMLELNQSDERRFANRARDEIHWRADSQVVRDNPDGALVQLMQDALDLSRPNMRQDSESSDSESDQGVARPARPLSEPPSHPPHGVRPPSQGPPGITPPWRQRGDVPDLPQPPRSRPTVQLTPRSRSPLPRSTAASSSNTRWAHITDDDSRECAYGNPSVYPENAEMPPRSPRFLQNGMNRSQQMV